MKAAVTGQNQNPVEATSSCPLASMQGIDQGIKAARKELLVKLLDPARVKGDGALPRTLVAGLV